MDKILIIEDDKSKLREVTGFLETFFPKSELFHADSLQSASESLDHRNYDLIILDMSIPSHSPVAGSGRAYPLPVGGLDILLEVWTSRRLEKVIILSQFLDIEFDYVRYPLEEFTEFAQSIGIENLIATLFFDRTGSWKEQAKGALRII
jgi:CheY-like chemotaxis protein